MITGILLAGIAIYDTIQAPTIIENKGKVTESIKATSTQYDKPTVKELKDFLTQLVNTYGGNYALIDDVIQCESGWRTDVYSRNNISYGIAQFTPPTFSDFCDGEYKDPYAQLTCMVKMFNKGLSSRWDCVRIMN